MLGSVFWVSFQYEPYDLGSIVGAPYLFGKLPVERSKTVGEPEDRRAGCTSKEAIPF